MSQSASGRSSSARSGPGNGCSAPSPTASTATGEKTAVRLSRIPQRASHRGRAGNPAGTGGSITGRFDGRARRGSRAYSSGVTLGGDEAGAPLVDGTGRALYLFEADTGATSTCTGACAQVWPPLLTSQTAPATTGAAQPSLVGTSPWADGTQQVTLDGHRLYYFAGDQDPGDVKGQGIDNLGGGWYVVAPGGDEIDDDAPAPDPAPTVAPAHPAASGTGNGY